MLGSKKPATLVERCPQQRIGARIFAELRVDVAECLVDRGLCGWLTRQALRLQNSAVDKCDDSHAVGGADRLVTALKQIEREFLKSFCPRRLRNCSVPGRRHPVGVERGEQHDRREGRSSRCKRATMA